MNNDYSYYMMYRDADELSLLNKLFTTLISEKLNIMNYLSNTVIKEKYYLKDLLENLSYQVEEYLDKIATIIKIKKGYPIYKLEEIDLISNIKTLVARDYDEREVITNLKSEIKSILQSSKKIIEKTDDETTIVLSELNFGLKKLLLDLI